MNESYEYMLNLIEFIAGHGLNDDQIARVLIDLEEKMESRRIIRLV